MSDDFQQMACGCLIRVDDKPGQEGAAWKQLCMTHSAMVFYGIRQQMGQAIKTAAPTRGGLGSCEPARGSNARPV